MKHLIEEVQYGTLFNGKCPVGYRTGELIRMAAFALLGVLIGSSVSGSIWSLTWAVCLRSCSCFPWVCCVSERHRLVRSAARATAGLPIGWQNAFYASPEPEILTGLRRHRRKECGTQGAPFDPEKYLKNISLDMSNKRIMLTVFDKATQEEEYKTVVCPYCGGRTSSGPDGLRPANIAALS